ncbi:serine/threonine protein kinase [Candidatus Pantoea alvi]|uniref:serine/threonine protein kinase n=1 Tax=Enterobacter agglomerans TaxID=549 RepID=UPI000CDE2612|nr:protein kinase [Pantoea agglomerans]POW57028.1 serine/threonine protein kinase [Pantoea alvi]UBN56353.1 protein kinase [Pantoea agglomerans]
MLMEQCGNYLIEPVGVIGRGGFGCVEKINLYNMYQGFCGSFARKIFSPVDESCREEFLRRFKREVNYQALCSNSYIVPVVLHSLQGDRPYFVMSLADSDLTHDLRAGWMSPLQKLEAVRMVLTGIHYLHCLKYYHRDIKPSNVLRFSDGTYKVSDFGLVKNADAGAESELLTKVARGMGTEKYAAPEVYAGVYSERTDIYALGVLIEDMNMSDIPGVQELINKSTMRRPADRYQIVEQMIMHINKIIEGVSK